MMIRCIGDHFVDISNGSMAFGLNLQSTACSRRRNSLTQECKGQGKRSEIGNTAISIVLAAVEDEKFVREEKIMRIIASTLSSTQ
jgi:hypothetical protein